jgi:hypothetical protein
VTESLSECIQYTVTATGQTSYYEYSTGCFYALDLLPQTRAWIRAHVRDALRLQKPLLLTGVGALLPQPWRRQLLATVQQELARAVRAGHPVAGKPYRRSVPGLRSCHVCPAECRVPYSQYAQCAIIASRRLHEACCAQLIARRSASCAWRLQERPMALRTLLLRKPQLVPPCLQ